MDLPLFTLFGNALTPWKLVGYLGVVLFGARWPVQMLATRAQGKPVVPRLFWYMSLLGSALLTAYFAFGKNDSVGLLSNLFPLCLSVYNLRIDYAHRHARPSG